MPAVEHAFDEAALPEAAVLDADFVINVLYETEEFHDECASFARRFGRADGLVVYTPLLRLEVLAGWRNAIRRRGVPTSLMRQSRMWADPTQERRFLFDEAERLLSAFLNEFRRYEIRLSRSVYRNVRLVMADHDLKPMDALLVASAREYGNIPVVSLDSDLTRVDELELWNNHVPARRRAARARKR
jgi:predicted nucleic acid-binding protein